MLKEWEKRLLTQVLEEPEIFDGDMSCNDWDWPDYVSQEDRKNACLRYAHYHHDEILEDFNGDQDAWYNDHPVNQSFQNFMVPTYFCMRLKQEGIL